MESYLPPDALLLLRDINDGAETATATEAAVDFVAADHGDFKVIVSVTALDTVNTDETYNLAIEVDADSDFSTPVAVGTLAFSATGVYEIPLSKAQVENLESGGIKMRTKMTIGGTTPSITYGAYLTPA